MLHYRSEISFTLPVMDKITRKCAIQLLTQAGQAL